VSLAREQVEARLIAALAAGGRIVDISQDPGHWTLADRAGNRVDITAWPDGAAPPPNITTTPEENRVTIEHLNPESLYRSPVFSQGTVIPAGSKIVIVGGQDGIGADGQLAGDGIAAQTEQAMRNLIAVLEEAGAGPADVAKLTIYLVEGVDVNEAFAASRSVWGDQPTAVSAAFVRSLAVPGALVEVDAIAAIPG
jgi:enamine deaminase RidA (YjgF/YER057c/UK114 family)